jgi:diguanylate cyclase (GGDEF)-like protein
MLNAPIPDDDAGRLKALEVLGVLYSPAEERFDRITRLACKVFDAPISLVSLVAEKCQWFKSRKGLDVAETSRSISFCGHAILGEGPMIIPDTLLDHRFADNPLVTGEPYIRSYAGVVLTDGNGNKLGTLCIIDTRPRKLSESELDLLRDFGTWAENELRVRQLGDVQQELIAELDSTRREARIDPLTQVWNRRALGELLERELSRGSRSKESVTVIMLDLDHFKNVNDVYGHEAGDEVLREAARRMRSRIRTEDALCRYGGEEFIVILSRCNLAGARSTAENIRYRIASEPFEFDGKSLAVTASIGLAEGLPGSGITVDEIIRKADEAMYIAKQGGRNRVEPAG